MNPIHWYIVWLVALLGFVVMLAIQYWQFAHAKPPVREYDWRRVTPEQVKWIAIKAISPEYVLQAEHVFCVDTLTGETEWMPYGIPFGGAKERVVSINDLERV